MPAIVGLPCSRERICSQKRASLPKKRHSVQRSSGQPCWLGLVAGQAAGADDLIAALMLSLIQRLISGRDQFAQAFALPLRYATGKADAQAFAIVLQVGKAGADIVHDADGLGYVGIGPDHGKFFAAVTADGVRFAQALAKIKGQGADFQGTDRETLGRGTLFDVSETNDQQ